MNEWRAADKSRANIRRSFVLLIKGKALLKNKKMVMRMKRMKRRMRRKEHTDVEELSEGDDVEHQGLGLQAELLEFGKSCGVDFLDGGNGPLHGDVNGSHLLFLLGLKWMRDDKGKG